MIAQAFSESRPRCAQSVTAPLIPIHAIQEGTSTRRAQEEKTVLCSPDKSAGCAL